ncbi:MAG: hypothetical protein GF364_12230 [Candidatus Lokiarchaeota archaeon]|nr:hypothetical protein [Candidatus Lokiarchaeota archaeon]
MGTSKSEDTLIFLALDPRVTKYKKILRFLYEFFEKKQNIDATDRFNIISFIENGPIYFEDFTYNGNYIIKTIEQYIPKIKRINTIGGIFVAITFIIDIFKLVGGKAFRLIILMDKNTPRLKNIEVIRNLTNKVVEFPFYIDIIRIKTDDPKEDAKLIRFAEQTKGKVYFVRNEKDAGKVLLDLAEKKEITTVSFGDKQEFQISPENEGFFENMAQDPVEILNPPGSFRCQICGEKGQLYKCPKCGTPVHRECLAQWSKYSNIGLPHLFRCQSCFNLLRLDKDFVEMIQTGKKPKEDIDLFSDDWFSDQDALLREQDSEQELIFGQDPMPMEDNEVENGLRDESDEVFDLQKDTDNIEIIFCPGCGKLTTTEFKRCPDCGAKLK